MFPVYVQHYHKPENELVLVHVVEPHIYSSNQMTFNSASVREKNEADDKQIVKNLQTKYEEKMRSNRIRGRINVIYYCRQPGKSIAEVAKDEKCSLIVLGRRYPFNSNPSNGSTVDYLVKKTNYPVSVVVKPDPVEDDNSLTSLSSAIVQPKRMSIVNSLGINLPKIRRLSAVESNHNNLEMIERGLTPGSAFKSNMLAKQNEPDRKYSDPLDIMRTKLLTSEGFILDTANFATLKIIHIDIFLLKQLSIVNMTANRDVTDKNNQSSLTKMHNTKIVKNPSDRIKRCLFGSPSDEDLNLLRKPSGENRSRSFPQLSYGYSFLDNKEDRYTIVEKMRNISYPQNCYLSSPTIQKNKRNLDCSQNETELKRSKISCTTNLVTDEEMKKKPTVWRSPSKYGADVKLVPKQSSLDQLVSDQMFISTEEIILGDANDRKTPDLAASRTIGTDTVYSNVSFSDLRSPNNLQRKNHLRIPVERLITVKCDSSRSSAEVHCSKTADNFVENDVRETKNFEVYQSHSRDFHLDEITTNPNRKIFEKIESLDFVPIDNRIHLWDSKDSNEDDASWRSN
ncbi:hypothetical protein HELRODRAFT_163325 [Helobdella robusta]|uniref:UspA domain-containing protein n=1 Tax=Helobdella robusta TaxID=6412 RepID=T1ETW9_HELRO|nr:hypothetical protein HELRODRAFT_163325 [Helobdella robusta]ESN96278.1 hypothetical protein HELRODRAFT_163325 [Helobdella robusta]